MRSSVDLPMPLGPTIPVRVSAPTDSDTLSRTTAAPWGRETRTADSTTPKLEVLSVSAGGISLPVGVGRPCSLVDNVLLPRCRAGARRHLRLRHRYQHPAARTHGGRLRRHGDGGLQRGPGRYQA